MLLWTPNVTVEHFPILGKLKEMGFDGVELPIFDLDVVRFARVGHELNNLGLDRTAVATCPPEANPISSDSNIRAAAVNRLKKAIDCCQAAGSQLLCGPLHSALGEFVGRGPNNDELGWAQETLIEVAEYAKSANITLAIEALNRFECYFLNDVGTTSVFCRGLNHPNLKMMYDTFHANIEEKDLSLAMESCFDQVVHVHISENDRSIPGSGHVDWLTTFRALKELKYDGWLTVEAFGLAMPELAAATKIWRAMYVTESDLALKALEFMKKMMAK